jgi:hypothetical protein
VFSVGFSPRLHNEDPVPAELEYLRETVQTTVEDDWEEMATSSVETWKSPCDLNTGIITVARIWLVKIEKTQRGAICSVEIRTNVIVICRYDLWVVNKSIRQYTPRLQSLIHVIILCNPAVWSDIQFSIRMLLKFKNRKYNSHLI